MSNHKDRLITLYNKNCDPDTLALIQDYNAENGLNARDFEYLEKYIEICEKVIKNDYTKETAQTELDSLNESFKFDINSKTYRKTIVEKDEYNNSWSSSDCY